MDRALHLTLTADVLPGPLHLAATGALTAQNTRELISTFRCALALQGCPEVTVDLRELDHVDPRAWSVVKTYLTLHILANRAPRIGILPLRSEADGPTPHLCRNSEQPSATQPPPEPLS